MEFSTQSIAYDLSMETASAFIVALMGVAWANSRSKAHARSNIAERVLVVVRAVRRLHALPMGDSDELSTKARHQSELLTDQMQDELGRQSDRLNPAQVAELEALKAAVANFLKLHGTGQRKAKTYQEGYARVLRSARTALDQLSFLGLGHRADRAQLKNELHTAQKAV